VSEADRRQHRGTDSNGNAALKVDACGEIEEETLDNITVYNHSLKVATLQRTFQHYNLHPIP
jgi:hypothetical protein